MTTETLLTAARRVVRYFNIDEVHGGLMSVDTIAAIQTLDKMVRLTVAREAAAGTTVIPGERKAVISRQQSESP